MEKWEVIKQMSDAADEGWGGGYYHVLPKLINALELKKGVEIGVAFGGHSEAILKNTNIEKLYSIDPYTLVHPNTDGYSYPDGTYFKQEDYEELYVHALHRLRKYGDRSELMRLTSHEAFAYVKDELDFVFVDGSHKYGDVYTDIYLWTEKIKHGGYIFGHDYGHPSHPDVTNAVNNSFSSTINLEDGYVWWVKVDISL
jgi:hypothetical protein